MQQTHESVATVIKLNDDLLNSDKNLFHVISSMEFFELFFCGFYGREVPVSIERTRGSKFKGALLRWNYNFTQDQYKKYDDSLTHYEIAVRGSVNQRFTESTLKETYGSFEFLDYKKINTTIQSEGMYKVNKKTGMIDEATYTNNEIIDDQLLYSKNEYSIATY